jgi:hypothetical protein
MGPIAVHFIHLAAFAFCEEAGVGWGLVRITEVTNAVTLAVGCGFALCAGVPVGKRCAQFPGYEFEPNRDSDRGDMEGSPFDLDMESVAKKCSAQPTCKAFNTGGYLKDELKPKAEWKVGQQSDDPCTGLYVRQSTGESATT